MTLFVFQTKAPFVHRMILTLQTIARCIAICSALHLIRTPLVAHTKHIVSAIRFSSPEQFFISSVHMLHFSCDSMHVLIIHTLAHVILNLLLTHPLGCRIIRRISLATLIPSMIPSPCSSSYSCLFVRRKLICSVFL